MLNVPAGIYIGQPVAPEFAKSIKACPEPDEGLAMNPALAGQAVGGG
ncbi:MAG: hypothetical protein IID13_09385 [Candidatus Marinimicrobia bacterium]|nr:hypothetical protein [Candidatus Neomarinimicrobiota bacterium]MCH8839016.1 hypothetical protein [Candidatus Neomarinimicrobiota bacterium]